ncbi:MAG: uracil phosphoribosyltransferase [Planctomycetota bacterium]|jgi:uracil phosphoribosyltransferase
MGLHVIDHPLVHEAMAVMRSKHTGTAAFRDAVRMASAHLFHEATADLPAEEGEVETPLGVAPAQRLRIEAITLVPVLRAGMGMLDGALTMVPGARVAHVGVRRDESTHEPEEYYRNVPPSATGTYAFVLDPMLATAGTMTATLQILEDIGMAEIRVLCLVAAPEGIRAVREEFPEVEIFAAAMDDGLDENAYIVPGLGDAGDRYFGTEG